MTNYPPTLVQLIKQFAKLPGIGEKTAIRLALHVMRSSKDEADMLAKSICLVKEKIRLCEQCYGLTDQPVCQICQNASRDNSIICVVEQTDDLASIEQSGAFKGQYHVLHGTISPMNGIGPDDIRIPELLTKVSKGSIKEIVIATNTNVEGEMTGSYIAKCLASYDIKISRIASGVPIGSDLKYIDQLTMKRAMENRHTFE